MQLIRSALQASAIFLSLHTLSSAAIIGDGRTVSEYANVKAIPDYVLNLLKKYSGRPIQKRQQVGATCFEDDLLSEFQQLPAATPLCSSFIDLPNITQTSTVTPTTYVQYMRGNNYGSLTAS